MYEIKRAERLEEEVKLGDKILKISLNLEECVFDILKVYNKVVKSEIEVTNASNKDELMKIYEEHGKNIIELFQAFFGEEQTEDIMKFFSKHSDGKTVEVNQTCLGEVMEQVGGYIIGYLMPSVNEFAKEKRKNIQNKYLGKNVL